MALPYKDSSEDKKSQVQKMFDAIARRYDFLNHFLSLGIDRSWRKKAVKKMDRYFKSRDIKSPRIIDIATGTADFAIAVTKLDPGQVIGIDISDKMLDIGEAKIKAKNLDKIIDLQQGDSENLEFPDNYFDGAIVAFGIRNYENLQRGLDEMARVMKKDGMYCILELSKPRSFPLKQLYTFYFNGLLPWVGKLISKDKFAYSYLPKSVDNFPPAKEVIRMLEKAGFSSNSFRIFSLGAVTMYHGTK